MVKKYKKDSNLSYTLGITLTIELLKFKLEFVAQVFIHSKTIKNESIYLIEELCKKNNIPIIYNDKVFNILSEKENCFVIGEFRKYTTNIDNANNHIVLVNPANSGNLGTIIRTMIGFGLCNLIIISPAVDVYDPKCIRSSMGALFHLKFDYYDNFKDYYTKYQSRNYYSFMLQANNSLSDNQGTEPYSLVFGNEATGLGPEYLNYGKPLIIKHSPNIDSLNLPIAVSLGIYEFTKNKFKSLEEDKKWKIYLLFFFKMIVWLKKIDNINENAWIFLAIWYNI